MKMAFLKKDSKVLHRQNLLDLELQNKFNLSEAKFVQQ